jgi:FMN-dependent NADH-azoreductase
VLVRQFVAADAYIVAAPMWNFSIPYQLKHYIDCIIQPGYCFAYNAIGVPEPLLHDRTMLCVTSRGADYSTGSPLQPFDFQEPYLRSLLAFTGITQVDFIHAQPMDAGLELREAAVARALQQAASLALEPHWSGAVPAPETASPEQAGVG